MPLIESWPAEQPPARQEQSAAVQRRLGLGHHPPGQLGLEHRLHHPERHADEELVSPATASSSSTRVCGSSVSRAASTQPADPAPTIT
jgi:hypothetical protein